MKQKIIRAVSVFILIISTIAICFGAMVLRLQMSFEKETQQPVTAETTEAYVEQTTEVSEQKLVVTYPDSQKITVKKSEITVSGVYKGSNAVTVNGENAELLENGEFSYNMVLNFGENKLSVSDGEETYNYVIIYKLEIIKAVDPAADIKADAGKQMPITALALKDSSVQAVINGVTIELSPDTSSSEQFVNYSAFFTVPSASSKPKNLGKIIFNAKNGGHDDSVTGGSIIVNPYNIADIVIQQGQGAVIPPQITGNDVVNVLSPEADHGRGQAHMCIVTSNYGETMPDNKIDDKSDPRYTPEPKGTIDYITDEFKYEKDEYYILLSGMKIKKTDVRAFNGYIMPTNTISAYKSYTSGGYTNAILTMNWKVPFLSEMKQQSYYRGYAGRNFNVSSFTASYIDFNFKYTNAASGSFDFSSSSVVSHAEWIGIGDKGTTTLRVYFKNAGKFYGYKAYYSNDNRLVIQFKERPNTASPLVVIDPGHGGNDCGAIAVNGTYEAHLNLRIAAMVKSNLESAGYRVHILRTGDNSISLDDRQAMGRKLGGDIFVSIHNNSSPSSSLSGTEVYYYRAHSKALASSIHARLAGAWREIYADNPQMSNKAVADDGGVRYYPFRVTRIEECPAVLVEGGYLSNPTECEYVCNSDVQQRLAKAISDGIINYFNNL